MANEIGRLVSVVAPALPASVVPTAVHVVDGLAAVNGVRIGVDIHRRGRDDDVFFHCNGRMRRSNFGCAPREAKGQRHCESATSDPLASRRRRNAPNGEVES
jgi:hypothetical protein